MITLSPTLEHCIETTAKAEFNRITGLLLNGQTINELADRAELLREFLSAADFKKLRADSEKLLLNNKRVRFQLYREQGALRYQMLVE